MVTVNIMAVWLVGVCEGCAVRQAFRVIMIHFEQGRRLFKHQCDFNDNNNSLIGTFVWRPCWNWKVSCKRCYDPPTDVITLSLTGFCLV